jgi:hypothetical protein
MREPMPEDEDKRLEMMFRELAAPVADDGFSARVMTRVSQTAWRRRVLLTVSGAIGAAFAVSPVLTLLNLASHEVAGAAGRWHELTWLMDKPVLVGVALIALIGPVTWRWLEE